MKYTYEAILIVEPVKAFFAERAASPDLARQACKA